MFSLLKSTFSRLQLVEFNTRRWLEENAVENTPDLVQLEKRPLHLVFICDTLMQGKREHQQLEHPQFKGFAYTVDRMVLWRKDVEVVKTGRTIPLSVVPYVDPKPTYLLKQKNLHPTNPYFHPVSAVIKGQVFLVPTSTLITLDKMKENGKMFERKRMSICISTERVFWQEFESQPRWQRSAKKRTFAKAWMYVGLNSYWDSRIDAGYLFKPATLKVPVKPWREEYYWYTD
jgi:hypothetical protein